MILTVTLNAALDITYRVSRLEPRASHRVREVTERPGGKGLNVARVLGALGHETLVTGFTGGPNGDRLRTLLSEVTEEGPVGDAFVAVGGDTRRTVTVVDEASGGATVLDEPGPHVTTAEWERFLDVYGGLLHDTTAVALCGSLPPGVPVGAYGTLVRAARTAGVPVLLDTSGEPLLRGLAARPDVVKPNSRELAGVTGTTEPLRAARLAQRRGAHSVVASLGEDGLLGLTSEGVWRVESPRRLTGNPTGAGDSVVAALLSGLVEGLPWPDRLARAAALSAATVRAGTAGEFDRELYEKLLPGVRIDQRMAAV
ncbi:1-phosphofructokinase family hexose kinase [Streptomyces sp. CNQ085]|uniref:1-phosphofructokinase family hexose kinase n=1 Tax=Streptomyces sp. CNQ085 TaxID=2886944 RepID=UPI001F5068B5|nr:1-phosphofructokinase family hexose kinase [Streptomyces sp. CNQ085]MCI0386868.1 1-phosphofructokinase family hexose kinase [Streptomyces sp. CNQ085]